jgi:hypothetical protein
MSVLRLVGMGQAMAQESGASALAKSLAALARGNSVRILLLVLLLHLPLLLQGLDMTDLGWHLTNQIDLLSADPSIEGMEWQFLLSQYAGGVWLGAIGKPSVLWARLAGALLVAINAGIVYSILANHFPGRGIALPVMVTALLLTGSTRQVRLDYFTFPAFLILVQMWFLDRGLSGRVWGRWNAICSFMFGLMFVPVAMGRLPLGLMVLGLGPAFLYLWLRGARLERMTRVLLVSLAGLAVSAALAVCVLSYHGMMDRYVAEVLGVIGGGQSLPEHELAFLVRKYSSDLVRSAAYAGTVIVALLSATAMIERMGERRASVVIAGGLAAALALSYLVFPQVLLGIRPWRLASITMLGLLSVLALVVLHFGRGEDPHLDVLIIFSWFAMLVTPLGSNTGLYKATYGMWLPLPLLYLRAHQMHGELPCRWVRGVTRHLQILLVLLLAFSVPLVLTSIYRDDWNRLRLTVPFSHPSLRGIYSTRERVDTVEGVLEVIEAHTDPGDRVLIINSVPILYYLTGTRPAMGNPWLFLESLEEIEGKQEGVEATGMWPKLFCCNKLNSRDPCWPRSGGGLDPGDGEKLEYLLDLYSGDPAYRLAFETEVFSVFVRGPRLETKQT